MKQLFLSILLFFLPLATLYGTNDADTLFSIAVQAGNAAKVREALQKGANVNLVEEEWPLFITSVTAGDVAVVSVFLENGVDTELRGPDGKTALMHSLSLRNNVVTNMLIKAGADITASDPKGKNVMMYAAKGNNVKVLKMLLDKGIDRTLRSSEGKTALDYAVEARAGDCFRMLSQIDKQPMDFFNAIRSGNEKKIRELIREGVPVDIRDKKGKAGIVAAIEKGQNGIVRILLENGADPNESYFKSSDADLFVYAMHLGNFEAAELLLRRGARGNFNHRFKGGKSAMMIAIEKERLVLINLLMNQKFDPDLTDDFGNTALMYAAKRNMITTIRQLLSKNADPTKRQVEGKKASDIAKERGHTALARILQEAEAKWD